MWTGKASHPALRVIIGIIALVVGLMIRQPILDIAGVICLAFAAFQLVGRGNGGGFRR